MADIILKYKISYECICSKNKRKSHLETIMEHINEDNKNNKMQLFQIKKHVNNDFLFKYVKYLKYWSNANRTRINFVKKYTECEIKISF